MRIGSFGSVVGLGALVLASCGSTGTFDTFAQSFCQWRLDCKKTVQPVSECVDKLRREDGGFFANCAVLQEQYAKSVMDVCMTPNRPCTSDNGLDDFCPETDWSALERQCKGR